MNTFNIVNKLENILDNSPTIKKYKDSLDIEHKIIELQAINHFINELSKLKHCDFTIFINNLENLEITEINKNLKLYLYSKKNSLSGWYSIRDNKIYIRLDRFYVAIYHELLHVATTYSGNDKYKSGFSYYSYDGIKEISKALNEGYTQLITDRYFIKRDSIYKLYKHFAKHLEIIIGQEKMEYLYFKTDLVNLYTEIYKYNNNINDFNEFILNLDYIMENEDTVNPIKKNKILKKIIKLNEFLLFAYLEKLNLDNNINEKEVLTKLLEYIDSLSKIRMFGKDNGPLIDKINLKELKKKTENILDSKQKKLIK